MPIPTRPTARRKYTAEDVQHALDLVKNGGTSIAAAARSFGIPKSTLQDKLAGKYREDAPVGRPSVLSSEEEDLIEQWVVKIARAGFPVTKEQLLESVSKLVKDLNRSNPFNNSCPGEKWFTLFMKRHPIIRERVSQALTSSRAAVTEEQLKNWFGEVRSYLAENSLLHVLDNPERIFNADETAFFLCPKGKKVLARKGEKSVHSQTGNDEKECLTVLVNANGAGRIAPPMVVYPYERIPAPIGLSFPDEWGIGKSESGWMTCETFFEYITNVFHPWLTKNNIPMPVILFIDGHNSHLSKYLSDYCSDNQIEVIALYPNSTHLLQPLDVAVFRPLKAAWKRTVDKWRFQREGRRIKRDEFAPLLKTVFDESLKKETVVNGFKATGLIDLDPEKITFKVLNRGPGQRSTNYLEMKKKDITGHLNYLETKIGLTKVQLFNAGQYSPMDESLYQIWNDIKTELQQLKKMNYKH